MTNIELQAKVATKLAINCGAGYDDLTIIRSMADELRKEKYGNVKDVSTRVLKLYNIDKYENDDKDEDELKRRFLNELYSHTLSLPFDVDETYERLEKVGAEWLEDYEVDYLIAQYGAMNYMFLTYMSVNKDNTTSTDKYVVYQQWYWGMER